MAVSHRCMSEGSEDDTLCIVITVAKRIPFTVGKLIQALRFFMCVPRE